MNKKRLIIAAIGLVVVIAAALIIKNVSLPGEQKVSDEFPVDVVLNYYESWADAARDESMNPYQEGMADNEILSEELRSKLADSEEDFKNGTDPVLCQAGVPETLSARISYELEDEIQFIVLSRDEGFPGQSIATLGKFKGGWYIKDITCSQGEFGVEKEFSFEKDGYLLKNTELGTNGLYFIYAENGVFGSAAPLFFGPESMCKDLSGNESVCNTESFGEKTKAVIRGQLTEAGIDVKQVEFVEGPLSFE